VTMVVTIQVQRAARQQSVCTCCTYWSLLTSTAENLNRIVRNQVGSARGLVLE
jgi:hypothetical protein